MQRPASADFPLSQELTHPAASCLRNVQCASRSLTRTACIPWCLTHTPRKAAAVTHSHDGRAETAERACLSRTLVHVTRADRACRACPLISGQACLLRVCTHLRRQRNAIAVHFVAIFRATLSHICAAAARRALLAAGGTGNITGCGACIHMNA